MESLSPENFNFAIAIPFIIAAMIYAFWLEATEDSRKTIRKVMRKK